MLTEVWHVGPSDRLQVRAGSREAIFAQIGQGVGASMRTQSRALIEDGLTSLEERSRVLEGA